ncbi:MAG: flagellar basal-body MS-ring/collar protein FliF [Vampirovibrionia bacterium]
MNNLMEQLKKWWEERSFSQKFSLMFLIVALIAILTYLFTVTNQPDWDVLYDDLAETDAAAVASHLKENGVLFRISNGGKTILVPKEIIRDTKLEVAEANLISQDHVGLEVLPNMPLGLTQSQQVLWKQRIIQGELARTIERIKGVKKAKVNVAEGERSIFSSEDEAPKASVMLELYPGAKLKPEKIQAVKNLVAHSIPRLTPDEVFVSDENGTALSEDATQSGSSLDDLKSSHEKRIAKKVTEVLSKLVGNGNMTVAVTAEMNFDKATAQIERYIPTTETEDGKASGVLVSEQILGEQYIGKDGKTPQGGTPGTASNVTNPTYVASSAGGNDKSSDYNKQSTIKNFEVSKEIRNITYAPGQIERLTVAVAINKILTSEQHEQIKNLVETASGADLARGDQIIVTAMAFAEAQDLEAKQKALEEQAKMDSIYSAVETFGPYILVIIFGGTTLLIFWSLIKRPARAVELPSEEDDHYDYPDIPEILEAASIPVIEAKLDPEIERMREEINGFVMSDPAEAARLLLTYIKE